MDGLLRFIAARVDFNDRVRLDAARNLRDGGFEVLEPATWHRVEPDEAHHSRHGFLELRPEEAQRLMDALWDAGLRPSEGSGSAGALLATQNHLNDMRALVFKAQGLEVPRGR